MTPADQRILTPPQLAVLTCPHPGCGRLLVRPLGADPKKANPKDPWLCQCAGHTGLMQGAALHDRFVHESPDSQRRFDPTAIDRAWAYAEKRSREGWQTVEQLNRAEELAKARKKSKARRR